MTVYDDQKQQSGSTNQLVPDDDELRRMTGINKEQEEAYDREARLGANQDMAQAGQDESTSSSSKSLSRKKLQSAESKPASEVATPDRNKEGGFNYRQAAAHGFLRGTKGKNPKKRSGKKKKLAFGLAGGSGAGLILIVGILIFSFIGSFKYVHFATVLRSVAFARFTNFMNQEYSQTIFDTAVLDPASTGSFNRDLLGDRSIFDIIRGVNPEQQLIALGRSGDVKFNFSSNKDWLGRTTDSFEGVTIKDASGNGQFYSVDGYAQDLAREKLLGPGVEGPVNVTYDSLGTLDRLKVRTQLSSDLRGTLSDDLSIEGRDLVASLKGLQAAFGFKLVGFTNFARSFLGKTEPQADAEASKESFDATQGTDAPVPLTSLNDETNQATQGVDSTITSDLAKGVEPDVPKIIQAKTAANGFANVAQDAKTASKIVLLATGYCVLRDLRNSALKMDKLNQANAVRQAALIQSRSDQIRAGDVNAEAAGAASASFDGAQDSPLYQNDTGQNVSTSSTNFQGVPNLNATSILTSGPINTIYTALTNTFEPTRTIPGLKGVSDKIGDQACTVLLNPVTQITGTGLEIIVDIGSAGQEGVAAESLSEAFTVGLQQIVTFDGAQQLAAKGTIFAGQYILFSYAGNFLSSFVKSMSGLDYSGLAQGSDLYNQGKVGTDYMAASSERQVGFGRPVSAVEAAQSQAVAMNNLKQSYDQSSMYNRYFSIDNPFSLMGNIVAGIPSSFSDIATNISTAIPRLISKLGSLLIDPNLLGSLFDGKQLAFAAAGQAIAQQNNNFGVQQWDWSPQERQIIQTDPSYSLEENSIWVELPQNYQRLKTAYNQCYQSAIQNIPGDDSTTPPICSSTVMYNGVPTPYLGTPDALHWRKYQVDKFVETQMSQPLPTAPATGGGA